MRPKLTIISPTQGTYGGIEITAIAQAEKWKNHFPTRIHFKLTRGMKMQESLAIIAETAGVSCTVSGRGFAALWTAIKRSSMVHAHNVALDVVLTAILLEKPLFLTIHNRFMRGNWRHRMGFFLQNLALRRVYNSDFVRSTWRSAGCPTAGRQPSVSRLPLVSPLPTAERKGFFFIGRWIANKGIDTLLSAYLMAKFDHTQHPLYLAGGGPLVETLTQYFGKPEENGIHFLGRLTDDEKFSWFSRVRWNVAAPNTLEDMGLTPIEARHCHTPSVITRDGGLPEAGGEAAIICAPGSVDSLRAALEYAASMSDTEYGHRCGLAHSGLRSYLTEPFDWAALYASCCPRDLAV